MRLVLLTPSWTPSSRSSCSRPPASVNLVSSSRPPAPAADRSCNLARTMVRHNNVISNNHFRKEWQLRVRTWFNQPARKQRRRSARQLKAARIAPRPVDGPLRPVVRCPTNKYNMKQRLGRGFTFDELKAAGILVPQAASIGIAVDHRRKNRSQESMDANVERLREYKSKLVLFPRRAGKPKAGDSDAAILDTATQLTGKLQPIVVTKPELEIRAITEEDKAKRAYALLREARADLKHFGVRSKRAAELAAKEEEKKK
ncbi:hypothetical protein I4F81_001120 [Pyropia yezoensis]|uniref:Uncharacterized protein n=1 Tax=Pyropia yezoensis TaxID=2788 RepID=A0ACC3BKQ4_PYRYE|nr:hypothetical protein I4F81_001120 [Neopyropia yezoensis]